MWGYVNPGNPEAAAAMAWRDARLSHVKNGLYGPMFIAATIAAAFVVKEPRAAVEIGLSEIPERCRLREAILDVIVWCEGGPDWRDVWQKIETKHGHYHRVHTINNACYVAAGVLLSGGDVGKGICTTVACGLDTDSTGASTGSILGALRGAASIDSRWTKPLNDTVVGELIGFQVMKISELARRTEVLAAS